MKNINLENAINAAIVKTIVRLDSEKAFEDEGKLEGHCFDHSIRHPYIMQNNGNIPIAFNYFYKLYEEAKKITEYIGFPPEIILHECTGLIPSSKIWMEAKPYGIHLYVQKEDLCAISHYFSEGIFAGMVMDSDEDEIWISVGATYSEDKGETTEERMFKVSEHYRIANHELEHLHNRIMGIKNDYALDETIAHLNHYALAKGLMLCNKEAMENAYKEYMGESFDDFYSTVTMVRNGRLFKNEHDASRIFPMVLGEIADFDYIKENLLKIGGMTRKLDGIL